MTVLSISAIKREKLGTKASQAYRDAGQVPVSVSRSGDESLPLMVSTKECEALLEQGLSGPLTIDGQDLGVVVKKVSRNPLNDSLIHVDLLAAQDDTPVVVEVPVVPLTKNSPGVRAGGLIEQSLRKVKIRVPAGDLPSHVYVDLAGIQVGQTVYAEAVQLPEKATLLTKPRVAMVTIIRTRGMRKAENETGEA
jgi:large subunit ribosomal protein L25